MTTLILSRWQFGITTIYHFFFVPLTLGLGKSFSLGHAYKDNGNYTVAVAVRDQTQPRH